MSYNIDKEYFGNFFSHIVKIPSPTGYYRKLNPVLEQYAAELGLEMTYDNKSTAYLTVPGATIWQDAWCGVVQLPDVATCSLARLFSGISLTWPDVECNVEFTSTALHLP